MRNIIIHYHVFKNAGSTLAAALQRTFREQFAFYDKTQHNQRIQPQELASFIRANPHLLAVSSHHLRPPAIEIEGVRFYEILILRDPLDRLRSMYDFYRVAALTDDPLTHEAKHLDVRQFVLHLFSAYPNLITNPQVNLVANGGARIPNDEDTNRAIQILKDIACVGLAEKFDETCVAAEHSLRPVFPKLDLSYVPENVTPGRANRLQLRLQRFAAECGMELYQRITAANQLDTMLVEASNQELSRRLDQIGSHDAYLEQFRNRLVKRRLRHAVNTTWLRFGRCCNRLVRRSSSF